MVGVVGAQGEGIQSTATKFGSKRERTSEFGINEKKISVDMEHADGMLSTVAEEISF